MKTGLIPGIGLCNSLKGDMRKRLDKVFKPQSWSEYAGVSDGYWGYSGSRLDLLNLPMMRVRFEFTPMRQTIMLFLAAMNNEL